MIGYCLERKDSVFFTWFYFDLLSSKALFEVLVITDSRNCKRNLTERSHNGMRQLPSWAFGLWWYWSFGVASRQQIAPGLSDCAVGRSEKEGVDYGRSDHCSERRATQIYGTHKITRRKQEGIRISKSNIFLYFIFIFKNFGKSSVEYVKCWAIVFLYSSWKRTLKVIAIDS